MLCVLLVAFEAFVPDLREKWVEYAIILGVVVGLFTLLIGALDGQELQRRARTWATLIMASQELSVILDRHAHFNEALKHAQAAARVAAGDLPAVRAQLRAQLPDLTDSRLAEHDEIEDPRIRLRTRLRHPELEQSERLTLSARANR